MPRASLTSSIYLNAIKKIASTRHISFCCLLCHKYFEKQFDFVKYIHINSTNAELRAYISGHE